MWQTILWQIVLFILPILLKVTKDLIERVIKCVIVVEEKEELNGTQKRELVTKQMKEELEFAKVSVPLWVLNTMIEIGVSYMKSNTQSTIK